MRAFILRTAAMVLSIVMCGFNPAMAAAPPGQPFMVDGDANAVTNAMSIVVDRSNQAQVGDLIYVAFAGQANSNPADFLDIGPPNTPASPWMHHSKLGGGATHANAFYYKVLTADDLLVNNFTFDFNVMARVASVSVIFRGNAALAPIVGDAELGQLGNTEVAQASINPTAFGYTAAAAMNTLAFHNFTTGEPIDVATPANTNAFFKSFVSENVGEIPFGTRVGVASNTSALPTGNMVFTNQDGVGGGWVAHTLGIVPPPHVTWDTDVVFSPVDTVTAVSVELTCTGGNGDESIDGGPYNITALVGRDLTVTGWTTPLTCTVTQAAVPGYTTTYSPECTASAVRDATRTCLITNTENTATFEVSKTFSDASAQMVTVTPVCSSGTVSPTSQMVGHNQTVQFTVTGFLLGATCYAHEGAFPGTPPAGYSEQSVGPTTCSRIHGLTHQGTSGCSLLNVLNTDTITVSKSYSDSNTDAVDVHISCTSGNVENTNTTMSDGLAAPGADETFTITGFNQADDESGVDTTCTITESGLNTLYYQTGNAGCDPTLEHEDDSKTCAFENSRTAAHVTVKKEFDDDNPMEVDVTLLCNGGSNHEQHATLTDFSTTGDLMKFSLSNFDHGITDCWVVENDPPAGYDNRFENVSDVSEICEFDDVLGGSDLECIVHNELQEVRFSVNKIWDDPFGIEGEDFDASIYYSCDGERFGSVDGGAGTDTEVALVQFDVYPHWNGLTRCSAWEKIIDSGVETDASECSEVTVQVGSEPECTIYNTRFWEGIPTLNNWGLLVLSLLMAGMGLIAVRARA